MRSRVSSLQDEMPSRRGPQRRGPFAAG
jgi:hypothetical protein